MLHLRIHRSCRFNILHLLFLILFGVYACPLSAKAVPLISKYSPISKDSSYNDVLTVSQNKNISSDNSRNKFNSPNMSQKAGLRTSRELNKGKDSKDSLPVSLKGRQWYERTSFRYINHRWLGFGVSGGAITNPDFKDLLQFEVNSGRYIDKFNYLQISAGIGKMDIKGSSKLNQIAKKEINIYSVSLEFKSSIPTEYDGLIKYFLLGVGLDYFCWDYKTPIETGYYEYPYSGMVIDKIEDDKVGAIDVHVGIGLNLAKTDAYQFLAEITPGYYFPGLVTGNGLENQLINKSFYLKLRSTVSFPY